MYGDGDGLNLSESVAVTYANNINAGLATANASYAESANHLGSSDSENFTIDKAATTTVITCPTNVTYTGVALEPCTAMVTGPNLSEPVAVTYTNNVNAGVATANATYAESANHLGSSDAETFTIDKASLTITAVTNSKTYDGTNTALAIPIYTGQQGTDTVTGLVEVYDNKHVGMGKTLSVSAYTVNDGNSGNNYTVTTVDDTTGVIGQATRP